MTDVVIDPAAAAAPSDEATPPGAAPFGDRAFVCNELRSTPEAMIERIVRRRPDVVVFGQAVPLEGALAIAARLDLDHPEITSILVAAPSDELWRLAADAGIRTVVDPNEPNDVLDRAVHRALERADRQRDNAVTHAAEQATSGRLITVLSPKGGVGKTTVATNLAAGLARVCPQQTCIVDLDLQFGDVADALLLTPQHTMADLGIDSAGAEVKLALTASEGLYALCAPDDPATGEQVDHQVVGAALDALVRDLRYVVVDTGAGIDPNTLAAVERSTDLVLVASLDVPSVRSVRKLLDALDRLGLTQAERHLVLNRSDSKVGIDARDVAATLGLPIAVEVPGSREFPLSTNTGIPLSVSDPKSVVGRAFHELVGRFAEVEPLDGPRRRPRFRSTP